MACPAPGMPSPSSYPDSHGRREAKHPETIIPSPCQPVGMKKTLTESCGGVVIISRILTLQNFNSRERQSRNIYIPLSPSSRFSSTAGQGGPPGVAIRPLSHCNGVLVALQRDVRCNAARALRQDFRPDFIAHFHDFRRNTLALRQ